MRHIQQRGTSLLQRFEHRKEMIGFCVRERGRRFVEHQNPAVKRKCAGDLQQLPVRRGKEFRAGVRVDAQVQPVE